LANAVDPASPDALNFTRESQPLVDAAFLAQGLLRAPLMLAGALDQTTRKRLVEALTSTRAITPGFSNWLMFSATVEAGLKLLGRAWDRVRVDYALRQHEQWYKGDGTYGDGPSFHWDYYNSFVIQPMLLDVVKACGDDSQAWSDMRARVLDRARRYGAILERLVGPDGTFPPIGRSLAYRCGAFHLLAALSLSDQLPDASAAGAGACRVGRRHPSDTRCARDLRRERLAHYRLRRASARHRRALHLNGKSVPVRGGVPAARPGGRPRVLDWAGHAHDRHARVERAGIYDRSCDLELRRRPAAIARPPAFVG
jgi:hypothetical protein